MKVLYLLVLLVLIHPLNKQSNKITLLRGRLLAITRSINGRAGIAIKNLGTGDTLSINGNDHMVMQSVMKFPIALAVLNQIDRQQLRLNETIHILSKDLPLSYTSVRHQFPSGADIPVKKLLQEMISQSDNNACDILVKRIGGIRKVENYIHSLGIREISIKADEQGMAKAWIIQYTNWCTPVSMIHLIDLSYVKFMLKPASKTFLWTCMEQTTTGIHRLKGLLPQGTYLAHKTGSSATNHNGISPATNDVGIIKLPNGQVIEVVVLITDSKSSEHARDLAIANIGKAVYDYELNPKSEQ